jgi:putative FmdB family regulatory protein
MPIYTYRCENCGVQFDKTQKFTDSSLTRCPECNKKTLRKVYMPVGIVFKGSGFYATDHHSPSGMNFSGQSSDEKEKAHEAKLAAEKPAESKSSTDTTPKTEKKSSDSKEK